MGKMPIYMYTQSSAKCILTKSKVTGGIRKQLDNMENVHRITMSICVIGYTCTTRQLATFFKEDLTESSCTLTQNPWLVQERRNCSALAVEIHFSCRNPSI